MPSIFTSTLTKVPYTLDKEIIELINLSMELLREVDLYLKDYNSNVSTCQNNKTSSNDSGMDLLSPPLSLLSPPTFIYDIKSPAARYEIQNKFNLLLPFPLSLSPSLSHSSSLPIPRSTLFASSKKKPSCFKFSQIFKILKAKFLSKPSPPHVPSPASSTFDYKTQFKNNIQLKKWNVEVPAFLEMLSTFFQSEAFFKKQGIFRLSSNVEKLNAFIEKFKGADVERIEEIIISEYIFTQYHLEPCDALKRWIRDLPGKVFNSSMNTNLDDIAKMGITNNSVELLKALIFQMDVSKQHILKYVLLVSHQVLKHTDFNCMDAKCLSRTMGPNLFSLETSSIHSFNWAMDIFKLLLSKDVDYWFTIPTTE